MLRFDCYHSTKLDDLNIGCGSYNSLEIVINSLDVKIPWFLFVKGNTLRTWREAFFWKMLVLDLDVDILAFMYLEFINV